MTPLLTDKSQQTATILQKSVCLRLSTHFMGNNRKVAIDTLIEAAGGTQEGHESKVDEGQFHVTKRLLPTAELNPVMRVFSVAKAKLRVKAIAAHDVFGEGTYLIPLALVKAVDADLVECEAELRTQASALAYTRYTAAVEKQAIALGPAFKAGDYLTPAEVETAFSIDWSYVSFAAPDNLESVSHVLAARANEKHQNQLAQAYDSVLVGLRASALEVMTDLEARLTPSTDGKRKKLFGTALDDLKEFQAYLPARNLTGDDDLSGVMARVAARSEGYDVATLRDSDAAKAALCAVVTEAKDALAGLVQDAGRRAITFGKIGAAA